MADVPVTLADIYQARARIQPYVVRTPTVVASGVDGRLAAPLHLKIDSLQTTGSFKARGATHRLLRLTPAERGRGVVACSTGNHGRAVAAAARRLNIPATIALSELVPENKRAAIRDLGARLVVCGKSQDEAFEEAYRLERDEGLTLIDTFDHPDVIAGQGTAGLELMEEAPEIGTLLVPLSGGGLLAGMGVAAKAVRPHLRLVGVSMERGPAMIESISAGHPVQVAEEPSLADSLGGGIGLHNRWTFPMVRELADELVTLSEEEIAAGMRHLFRTERLVAEGAAAVGVAALLSGKVQALDDRPLATIVSGCNVDMSLFTRVVTDDAL
jgi:threonine dehydratase